MEESFVVHYTPELVAYAVRKYWSHLIGKLGFVSYALVMASWLYFVASGDRSWWTIGMGIAVVAFALFGFVAYRILFKRAMDKYKQLEQGQAKMTITDQYLVIESTQDVVEIPWGAIKKVLKYPRAWLVLIGPHYFTVPLDEKRDDLQHALQNKLPA